MARITSDDLSALFPGRVDVDYTPFITTADAIVDDLVVAFPSGLSQERLKQITLYLSGHFTKISDTDGALSSQTVGEATERYHNVYGQGLKTTIYGQQAILLDTTGYLANLSALAENTTQRPAEFRVI